MLIDKIYITDNQPEHIIYANIDSVNAYFEHHLQSDEILPAVLYSYYVDYYLSQVLNGGIAQFAYNTRWHSTILHYVEYGLHDMGASEHLNFLEKIADMIMHEIGIDNFLQFTEQNLFDDNTIRDKLNQFMSEFDKINHIENLEKINKNYLQNHPDLSIISKFEFKEILKNISQNPIIQTRKQNYLAELPSHYQYIYQLCEQYDCELLSVLDKAENDENWHFFTSRGRFFLQETADNVLMLSYGSSAVVASMVKN